MAGGVIHLYTFMAIAIINLFQNPCVAQIFKIQEAEDCQIVWSRNESKFDHTSFASGGTMVVWWGFSKSDSITWNWDLISPLSNATLALRYGYDNADMTRREGPQDAERILMFCLDGKTPVAIPVPETRGWGDFETVYYNLPPLAVGKHTLVLSPKNDKTATNLDCFTVFCGKPEKVLPLPFCTTVVARQKYPPIQVKMTPKAVTRWTPEQTLQNFTRIYNWFKDWMGWEPDRKEINVHIHEEKCGAFEDGAGVHFEMENFNWDVGNWCHEMNHVFDNGYFPGWTGHSIIRTMDSFDSIDSLFPDRQYPGQTKASRIRDKRNIAMRILGNPAFRTDDLQDVFFALRFKFGKNATYGFYHAIKAAADRKEIPLHRGCGFTKEQMVKYMSQAIGEDARPYFERWNGWKDAKP